MRLEWQHLLKWVASRKKVPYTLSQCHTKRMMDISGRAHPSFGMTPTFRIFLFFSFFFYGNDFFLFIFYFFIWKIQCDTKSRCYTKRRMGEAIRTHYSFGITPTQDIRDIFASRSPSKVKLVKFTPSCDEAVFKR